MNWRPSTPASTRVGSTSNRQFCDGGGVGDGVGVGVGDGVGAGVGDGVGAGVGDGVGAGVGAGEGAGVGVGAGDGEGAGDGAEGPVTATCRTCTGAPAMVTVAARAAAALAPTAIWTVAAPCPLPGSTDNQPTAVCAVHGHPPGAETPTDAVPPAAGTSADAGETS